MPRKKRVSLKKVVPVKTVEVPQDEMEELRFYVAEAEKVSIMCASPGWEILERDLNQYKSHISEKLAYIDPYSPAYEESRILYIASDKILKMIADYAENKRRALELLYKIDNKQDNIVLDMDN